MNHHRDDSFYSLKQSLRQNPFQYIILFSIFLFNVYFLFKAPGLALTAFLMIMTGIMFKKTPNSNIPLKVLFLIQYIITVILCLLYFY